MKENFIAGKEILPGVFFHKSDYHIYIPEKGKQIMLGDLNNVKSILSICEHHKFFKQVCERVIEYITTGR